MNGETPTDAEFMRIYRWWVVFVFGAPLLLAAWLGIKYPAATAEKPGWCLGGTAWVKHGQPNGLRSIGFYECYVDGSPVSGKMP